MHLRDPLWWLFLLCGASAYGAVLAFSDINPGFWWGIAFGMVWGELGGRVVDRIRRGGGK